jgi:DNA segregation ATPase FtsK/SpoIIIE, S-DNA-T family
MSTTSAFRRPPRFAIKEPQPSEIILQTPPVLPRAGSQQALMQLTYMIPMMLGMGVMMFFYVGRSPIGAAIVGNTKVLIIFGVLFVGVIIGIVVMAMTRSGAAGRVQMNQTRRDYQRYLSSLRRKVRTTAQEQRTAMLLRHPGPEGLWAVAASPRLWERRRSDPDFGHTRLGTGPQLLATALKAPQTPPVDDLDPVASTSLRHFIRTYASVPDLPVSVSVRSFSRIGISGDREAVLGLARAMLAQLVTFHMPADLRVAVCVSADRRADWDWLKWLPHTMHTTRVDAAGPVRLAAESLTEIEELLGEDLGERARFTRNAGMGFEQPQIIVITDGMVGGRDSRLVTEPGLHGVLVLDVGSSLPPPSLLSGLRLVVDGEQLGLETQSSVRHLAVRDSMPVDSATAVSQQLSDRFIAGTVRESPMSGNTGLVDLLGINDPRQLDVAELWRSRPARERLRIPIGLDANGDPMMLDFKESAEDGMGPHGLAIGATGSGKSELLRTLVIGLALTHSSETVNFVLVDFKGGATFAGLGGLPHTSAVITNLSDDLSLVDRMKDALQGELMRRQELLRSAGNYASVRDYERARAAGADLVPLSSLLVIIDEFSELLSAQPEFIDIFVAIGRLGRSLGVHLLLASQRLEEGRLRGLDSHLSYRIGLRTFSASESRTVLGVPDAYQLPPIPGSAYLKYDTETLVRFKTAYVSGVMPDSVGGTGPEVRSDRRVIPFTIAPADVLDAPALAPGEVTEEDAALPSPFAETVMQVLARQLEGQGPAAHQVWLPPLGEPPALSELMPPLEPDRQRGLCAPGWAPNGRLVASVGIVDKPFEQKRDLLWVELSGAAGNVAVVGGPQTGKSTLLRTMICSMSLTHTPEEVQFFCLDFGGGTLSQLRDLPHVSGVAGRLEADRCSRLVAEVFTVLEERERLFVDQAIDSMDTFRRRRRAGEQLEDRPFGDLFLVVDGWMVVRQEFEVLEEIINAIAARGLGYGIHVIITGNRWMDIRPATKDMLGSRFELKLGDPFDSELDRKSAANVPEARPGRGLTRDKLHFLGGLPRIDGSSNREDLADGTAGLVAAVGSAWRGEPAPRVRLLPPVIPASDMPGPTETGRRIPIGIAESNLRPIGLDFDTDPHLLVFGDLECGKTALLRLIARSIAERYTPAEAKIVAVDYRRGLLGELPETHLLSYAGSGPALEPIVSDIAKAMTERLPGPDVTTAQLRNRSWWKGPELFLLVDDYDLVAGQSGNPLTELADLLPQARDIGMHVIVTRRSGGAGRALYDPIIQRLRELGSTGLMMSADKEEGVLIGTVKPHPLPPGRGYLVSRRGGTHLVQVAWPDAQSIAE